MRKFKLLKDLPETKAGIIGIEDSGNVVFESEVPKPNGLYGKRYNSYPLGFVISKPEWFEEVKEEVIYVPEEITCPNCKIKLKVTQE